jgi:hypothetical protein
MVMCWGTGASKGRKVESSCEVAAFDDVIKISHDCGIYDSGVNPRMK